MNTIPHSASNGNLYSVYTLIDPRNYAVRYIGITDDVYARFTQHLHCEGCNPEKDAWITELKQANVMLIMKTLETVETVEQARERETFWIHHYRFLETPLLNLVVPTIQLPKRVKQAVLFRKLEGNAGRKYPDSKVKEIILHRLEYGTWPEGLSADMKSYYNKHYFKRGGKYLYKVNEWKLEMKPVSRIEEESNNTSSMEGK